MTVQALKFLVQQQLTEAEIADPENDARELIFSVFRLSPAQYAAQLGREATREEEEKLKEDAMMRSQHIPLQQITGCAHFLGRDFFVNRHVLIPRYDTETVVMEVLKRMKRKEAKEASGKEAGKVSGKASGNESGLKSGKAAAEVPEKVPEKAPEKVLDLGTGSGCILCSVLLACPEAAGVGSDISGEALSVAKINAERLGVKNAVFVLSDLFENIRGTYDIIVSNPPYIESDVIETLDPEVKCHEPLTALDGWHDGLHFYRKISEEAAEHLSAGGSLIFEIGAGQGASVRRIMEDHGFRDVEIVKDLSGHDRAAVGGV